MRPNYREAAIRRARGGRGKLDAESGTLPGRQRQRCGDAAQRESCAADSDLRNGHGGSAVINKCCRNGLILADCHTAESQTGWTGADAAGRVFAVPVPPAPNPWHPISTERVSQKHQHYRDSAGVEKADPAHAGSRMALFRNANSGFRKLAWGTAHLA